MASILTARQVADRLGVELATVYAYASRGALTRRPAGTGRRSVYDADEVEALAQRARPRSGRRRPGAIDVVIGTTVSEIGDGWIRYRGRDAIELGATGTFEDACRLLWTGEPTAGPDEGASMQATLRAEVGRAAARAAAALPSAASVTARLAAGAAAASALLPRRGPDAAPDAIGLAVVDALVAAIPPSGEDRPRRPGDALAVDRDPRASVAERLWPRVSPLAATAARLRALDVALVLMAEHELATSTLAVRVAASTGAGPAEVVGAGIATLAGPLHGRAAVRVHRHLLDGTVPDRPTMLDGFGHPVHVSGDPRFEPMVAAARSIASPKRRRAIDAYVARRRGVPAPNCDAALGALVFAAEGEPGASEAVFAVARTAGWVAHAFEEADEPPLRFRGRTLYRGPRP